MNDGLQDADFSGNRIIVSGGQMGNIDMVVVKIRDGGGRM